jgi:ABC-type branched-subunit amino acid transport system substrate-binding protein
LASAESQGVAMVNYAADTLRVKQIAILIDNGAQAKAGVLAIRKRAAERGLTILAEQEFEFRSTDTTPQVLSLRRQNPPALLLYTNAGEDTGQVLKSLQDIGWDVPVVGSITVAGLPKQAIGVAGPKAYENTVGVQYKAFSYCEREPVGRSQYAEFQKSLATLTGKDFTNIAPSTSMYPYSGTYVLKQVVEQIKSLDGAQFAEWLETSASKMTNPAGPMSADKSNHFLIGPDALVLVRNPERVRADGLQLRASCP